MGYDLLVLAGGRATRMGGIDKLVVPLGGRTSLERILDAAPPHVAVVAVGPRRNTARSVLWCSEDPPGGGPLAAIAAGLPLTTSDAVIVAAGDMPLVGEMLDRLAAALWEDSSVDVAVLCDAAGVRQPLAAAYRRVALASRLSRLGDVTNQPARLLLQEMSVIEVAGGRAATDCDTWDDVERLRMVLRHEVTGGEGRP